MIPARNIVEKVTSKEKYRQFSEKEKTIPLFSKGWWMDAVCGDNWDVILLEKEGDIIASLPYYFTIENGEKTIQKAPLTQTNGIWMKYPPTVKNDRKISFEQKVMNYMIENLESLNLAKYNQYYHYSFTNWLPFYWKGYNQTTRYTYVIPDTTNMELIYQNVSSNVRKLIRKAEKIVQIKDGMDIETFYEMNQQTFKRQNLAIPYSFEIVKKLDEACEKRNARKILYAVDKFGQVHSSAYFVWDDRSVYYLMSGSNPNLRSSQSLTYLLFEGIKLANKLGKKFDFEGSMKKNIEHHFRQFGAIQMPYFHIYKTF